MKKYQIKADDQVTLSKFDPDDTDNFKKTASDKEKAKTQTKSYTKKIQQLQERLYANGKYSLLIILQGMDTSGKDGTIKSVMSCVNPQGCQVATFKTPSEQELKHDFLWRVHYSAPEKGHIGIFNRSHYEDVLITRVHGKISDKIAKQRFEQINAFEEMLSENGTTIVKFFLHISKDEQKKRLEERIRNPEKNWKFNIGDIEERKFWQDYMDAFEDMIRATSTERSPWFVIPANRNWYRNLLVAQIVASALESMKLKMPAAPSNIDFATLKIE
ncbi:polyphosphate:nucleotide phosphotransferase, PPK2 family [Nitrosomonas sp. PY1]|uniref:polyphosphate kinase 2 family protein n=1 Tax=Nitrosomonas sp. PY1 TaxID=1803906 RepID=UPI001FC7D6E0|nr:polyphosphate kinase 2 family protein [Nitrosomonas sp. PY1]GKS68069.1 polyphosphate:nucleotide phosphotransferase, PPK2 family [Nitrosomonas sp. PY1]